MNPITWRSPASIHHRLLHFAVAERNTEAEMIRAANLCERPELAADFLRHAADEARHARMFEGSARKIAVASGLPQPPALRVDSSDLYHQLGERRFFAFVHLGEARAIQQFQVYRDFLRDRHPSLSALFGALIEDETYHARYTREQLVERPHQALRGMALWEAWQSLRRFQRRTARGLFRVSFFLLIPVLIPLSWWTARAEADPARWQP